MRASRFVAAVLAAVLAVQPALAQQGGPSILRDAETEAFLEDVAAPMAKSAGLAPGALKIMLIGDPSINAFVAQGQAVYMHSGLIEQADTINQVEGVIAHELGHIETGGGVITAQAGATNAGRISLLSLLLAGAAIAAGAGEAGMAALMAGQSAAQGKFLAYTRTVEAAADASAVRHLREAGYSGRGMVDFFRKLKREEYRLTPSYTAVDPFAVDHPMTDDRIRVLTDDLSKSPWWNKPTDPAVEARFLRVKAKLIGYLDEPPLVLRKYPESDQSVPAMYARAYAWHRGGYPERAAQEADRLVAKAPHDPYFLELEGQILLESGKPAQAVAPLREAVAQSRSNPLIASLLGHALVATEDPANLREAARVLTVAVQRDYENPQAWYNLGLIYTRLGDEPRASLASAERYSLDGNPRLALASAEAALHGLSPGTPDFLRAQDIALTARDAAQIKRRRQ